MIDFTSILIKERQFFSSGLTKKLLFRLEMLEKLEKWIRVNDVQILDALKSDLNKAPFESYATEIGVVIDELHHTRKHLESWTKATQVRGNIKNWPSRGECISEPYGVVLIMAPWNYPFQLMIDPLIAAIAAGNCVVIKPSAYALATSHLIEKMIHEIFIPEFVSVVEGDRVESTALLEQHFDMIFFTGSPTVGRVVMAAASKFLTPVTLELGGKSPCIVDETADLKLAAKRIVWGKFLNAGQTCVAPDYLLVQEEIKEQLIVEMKRVIEQFYGEALANPDFPKIINDKHFKRLIGLLYGEKIIFGGKFDDKMNKIEPTLLDNVSWEASVMQEEIFGPILPIISYKKCDEVVEKVVSRPKPLAVYIFTKNKKVEKFFMSNLSFGGGCVNDVVVHVSLTNLPFGGVGESGMGNYHGKNGFDTFSHKKSLLHKSRRIDIPLRYPPYKEKWLKLLKKL